MSFFEHYFTDADFSKRETAVCCPFEHRLSNGEPYFETNASSHINLDKGLFHCKVCNVGLTETSFISKLLGCSYEDAVKVGRQFHTDADRFTWEESETPPDIRQRCIELGISSEVVDELEIRTTTGDDIAFPVFMFDKVVDVRSYRPQDRENKIRSRSGATTGMIIPYDIWRLTEPRRFTVICAGEKDMAVTRSHGFNAITLTGGEKAIPKILNDFKGRRVAICYDHDDAGISGAKALASVLVNYCEEVRVVTGFHEVCVEHGEDLTDFFVKYKRTAQDLRGFIANAPVFTPEEAKEEKLKSKPLITLLQASQPQYINRVVQSNIQVVSNSDVAMPVPTTIEATKMNVTGDLKNNQMQTGQKVNWSLSETNVQDILHMIDNNFTEEQIRLNIRKVLGIPKNEVEIKVSKPTKETVYKCSVTDLFEATTEDTKTLELKAYSLKQKLESGKKYLITYKLVPNPYHGQELVMIILSAEDANDSVTNFRITDDVKTKLNVFRDMPGTVEERIEELTEMNKSFIGYNGYNKLIQAIDFSYNTVLEFNLGNFKNIRGYLDTIIVAESRVGKSSTAEALHNLYNLGAFASLAGNSATIPGLIGGSNKVGQNYQTRAGLIPMNHRGLIIFEELAKCNGDLIRELTDVRSSNQVRINRVSGNVSLPALVRMITLSNVKNTGGMIKPIKSYPNGIEVLLELVGTPEDVARYDLMLVMGDLGTSITDMFWKPKKAFDIECYRTRVRWIWSRTPEQVLITEDVGRYIVEKCNEINTDYDSSIKIFGTEAWKKVARLSIAVAGMLVSTDGSYEQLIVNKEHVDYAVSYLLSIYDNSTFKLKEYVTTERLYNTIDDDGVALLQDIYNQQPALLIHLERNSRTSKNNLMASSGLSGDDYNKVMRRLTSGLFVNFESYDIVPTQRFRIGMSKIDRNGVIRRVGEHDA